MNNQLSLNFLGKKHIRKELIKNKMPKQKAEKKYTLPKIPILKGIKEIAKTRNVYINICILVL